MTFECSTLSTFEMPFERGMPLVPRRSGGKQASSLCWPVFRLMLANLQACSARGERPWLCSINGFRQRHPAQQGSQYRLPDLDACMHWRSAVCSQYSGPRAGHSPWLAAAAAGPPKLPSGGVSERLAQAPAAQRQGPADRHILSAASSARGTAGPGGSPLASYCVGLQ